MNDEYKKLFDKVVSPKSRIRQYFEEIIDSKVYPIETKLDLLLDYTHYLSRYSYTHRKRCELLLKLWLSTFSFKDEMILDGL